MLLIVDIDGTLADWKPRDVEAGGNPGRKNMDKYKSYVTKLMRPEKLIQDSPIPGMLSLLRGLATREDVKIIYLTGRSEVHRLTTARWLLLNRFPEADIVMRGETDWRTAASFKTEMVKELSSGHSNVMALEDEPEVVEALVKLGATVLQVHYA
jgi:FMN phosphatase YigB (HAD superfamily)